MTVGESSEAVGERVPTLYLSGRAQLIHGNGTAHTLERKDAALLAYLALAGPTARAKLAAMLWPDVDEGRARTNLRQRLSRLRKVAGDLVRDDRGVLALAPHCVVDAGGRAGADAPYETLLATNDYDDCPEFYDWLDAQRSAHRLALRGALAAEVQRLRETDPDGALRAAQTLLTIEPESEDAYRLLIELYYLRGDTASALAAYGQCSEMLRRVYGATPSGATEALVQSLRAKPHRVSESQQRPIPLTLLRPPRMIGRAQALAAGRRALAARHVLVIAGESGIGKTRLIEELLAETPGRAIHFRARPADLPQPWGALRRLCRALIETFDPALSDQSKRELARLVPGFGRAPEPISSPAELAALYGAVCALVDACHRDCGGLRLAFDDLQFADVATVDALRALIRPELSVQGATAVVIVATRAEGGSWQARDLVAALDASAHAQAVLLQPLREQDTGELLAEVAPGDARWSRLAPALQKHCGGNPGFLLESLRAMLYAPTAAQTETGLPMPPPVQTALTQRLERLPDVARAIVELAAVAGSSFSLELAAHALALPRIALAPALREIEAAQIMRGDAFVHDLVEEAALRSLSATRRERLHLQVADFLQRAGAAPGLVAHHLVHAGDERGALPFLRSAVKAAEESLRPDEAARLLEDIARIELAVGNRTAGIAALADAFSMYMATSFVDDANRIFEQWSALAESPAQRLLMHARRAQQRAGFSYVEEALRQAETALDIAARHDYAFEPELLAETFLATVPALVNAGLARRAVALAQRIEPQLDLRRPVAELAYRKGLGSALDAVGRRAEAIAALRRAVALHEAGAERLSEWDTRRRLASYLFHAGRHQEAADEAQRAIEVGRKQPHFPTSTGTAHYARAVALAALGEYQEALHYMTSRRDYFRRTGWRADLSVGCRLALLYLHLGAPDLAREELPVELDLARAKTADRALHAFAGAALARAGGQPLQSPLRALLEGGFALNGEEDLLKARVLLAGARTDESAFDEAAAAFERARALDLVPVAREAAIAASRVALALERVDRAVAFAHFAVEHAAFCCVDTGYLPAAWWAGYQAFAAAGESAAARECVRRGCDWIERVAANHVPAELRASFRAANPVNRALLAAAARTPAQR